MLCDLATFGLHERHSFYQDFDSTSVVFLRPRAERSDLDVCLFALGLEVLIGRGRRGKVLQTEIFRRGRQGADRKERERGAVSRAEALPALCGPGLKSARRKQDVKDFQTPTRPLTER